MTDSSLVTLVALPTSSAVSRFMLGSAGWV